MDLFNRRFLAYDQNFALVCDAHWVQTPSVLNMMYQERMFSVKIDPSGLEEGRAHFTQLEAFECGNPDKGPVFRIPISVIKPKRYGLLSGKSCSSICIYFAYYFSYGNRNICGQSF